MKKRLEHTTPESAGISSRDVLRLIDDLEKSGTEMHGLMILRHGKVVAEGWWNPYAPGIAHGNQSLTKTFTGTAFGIAMGEGLVSLDERLIDIFPEYVPDNPGRYLEDLKMIHILTMGSGMESMPNVKDPDWKSKFFTTPIVHPPGDAFYYNSAACSMVGACIQKKTGLGLTDYLRPRLFDKIGIDADHIRWYRHEDGLENGSGGIVTTTEDNLRLIMLYMNGGVWGSQRILPEKWVRFATSVQNDHFEEIPGNEQSGLAYGGMMWINKQANAYYADGAMGQYSIGLPEKDMVISVTQTCVGQKSFQLMRNALFGFPDKAKDTTAEQDGDAFQEMSVRMKTLSLPHPDYAPYSAMMPKINNRKCRITKGVASFFADDLSIFNNDYHDIVSSFSFVFLRGMLKLTIESESGTHEVFAGMDGAARRNRIHNYAIPSEDVLLSASWKSENILCLDIRWIEVCRTRRIEFLFRDDEVEMISSVKEVGGFDAPPHKANAVWV